MVRSINKATEDLIKSFEGLRLKPYWDGSEKWTIGYGHTNGVIKDTKPITQAEAEAQFRADIAPAEDSVTHLVRVPLTDNQFGALVSFVFNCGPMALKTSKLLERLNARHYDEVPTELMKWTKSGGVELKGLERRRQAEVKLWNKK